MKDNVSAKAALSLHNYCGDANAKDNHDMETSSQGARRPLPDTPAKIPVPQKKLREEAEVSNAVILAAVNNLPTTIQELSAQLKINTVTTAEMAKSIEFNAKEIKDCKIKTLTLEKEVTKVGTENTIPKERILELERHKRY